nr:hypothetical protein [Candidatus Arsenophonus triatominarum]
MRMLIELPCISVQGTEDTDFTSLFARPLQYSPDGGAKQGVKQRPVIVEKRPKEMGHGESNMLPVAVG